MSEPDLDFPFHLDYELLEAYTDGTADEVDREIVETHIEDCPACRRLCEDLATLRDEIQEEAARAAQARLESPPRPPRRRPALWPAALLAGAATVAVAVWIGKSMKRPAPVQIARASPHPATPAPSRPRPSPAASPLPAPAKPAPSAAVQLALRTGRLPWQALPELQSRQVVLRGDDPNQKPLPRIAGLRPAATRVRDTRPTLTWKPVRGARRYEVLVADEEYLTLAEAQGLVGTRWRPDRSLPAGKTLLWEVHAFDRNGQEIAYAPNVRFAVLNQRQAAAFRRETKAFSPLSLDYAIACARYGLNDEAEATLTKLRSQTLPDKEARLLERLSRQ